uniref:protein-tyrosine-phosphatase n=1 Tax=Saccoglossus kowalevskii TaxID=10224 RepID=A0ABM0MZE7_SACKO|nr:PREDICTED: tyrosine-protein phosphatase non-receptor type 11-like [Saccoglossus kowalevskii]
MLDEKSQMLDGKSQMLDEKSQMLDGKSQMLDGKSQMLDGKSQMLDGKSQMLDGKSQIKQDKKSVQEHFTFDHTRVPLKDGEGSESYINANYIRPTFDPEGDNSETQPMYIATQGCLPQTVNDLWRMIWQEDSRVLVMTTKEIERGKVELIYTYFSFAIQILKIFDMIGSQ